MMMQGKACSTPWQRVAWLRADLAALVAQVLEIKWFWTKCLAESRFDKMTGQTWRKLRSFVHENLQFASCFTIETWIFKPTWFLFFTFPIFGVCSRVASMQLGRNTEIASGRTGNGTEQNNWVVINRTLSNKTNCPLFSTLSPQGRPGPIK